MHNNNNNNEAMSGCVDYLIKLAFLDRMYQKIWVQNQFRWEKKQF